MPRSQRQSDLIPQCRLDLIGKSIINNSGTGSQLAKYNLPMAGQRSPQFQSRNCVYSSRLKMRPYLYPKLPHFGHNPIENQTLVPENHPFRARPQRAPSACTSVMKSHCCTLQNYPNPNIHIVILSVARGLHVTALTFGMKLLWVSHFRGDRVHFGHETASGLRRLTCSRRIPYIPATVPLVWIAVPL